MSRQQEGRISPYGSSSFSTWKRNQKTLVEFTGANFVRHAEFPQTPIYGERQLGKFGSHRKGASGSADWFPFYDRCRFVVAKSAQLRFRLAAKTTLAPLLHLRAKSRPSGGCAPKRSNANPLRWALRWGPPTAAFINEDWESETFFITRAFCVGGAQVRLRGRRILRRFPIFVGAAHWAARGFRALHAFLQPCRGDPRGRPSVDGAAHPGERALQGVETSKAAGASPRPTSSSRFE